MDGKRHFLDSGGLNLFPLIGNSLANSQQLISRLGGLRMPQPSANLDSDRMQRMRIFNDHYKSNRASPLFNNSKEGTLGEPFHRFRYTPPEEDRFRDESWHRGRGASDREIPQHFLYPEIGPESYHERHQREALNRRNYGTPMTRENRVHESKYGSRSTAAVPWNAVIHPNCYLVPPIDDTYVLALSEKQQGCRSVFIGGLPSMADEEIITEIFSCCGSIEKITLTYLHSNAQVKHCLLQFVQHDPVDRAVKLNGHVLVIGDGSDRKTKIGRIRVDYHREPSDEDNHTEVNLQTQSEEIHLETLYSSKQVFHLLGMIRNDQAIEKSLDLLAHWLEKGECNRKTVNDFHTLLNAVNNLIKRLISRRKEHEQQVEKQKQQAAERTNAIKKQCEAVCKVFEAATKKRSWDVFTKAQRKNITQWQSAIKNEINVAKEAEIQNRVEVGMDLDDEVSSLGGLIEQPSPQIAKGEQDHDQAPLSPSKGKKRRLEESESDTDSVEALKSEKKKLQTQVDSLKAIAEQNSYLMWSIQSYQQQTETIRQQYSNLVAQKDYEIFQLRNALQGANIISDPQRAMSELDIVVEMDKDNANVMEADRKTGQETTGNNGKEEYKDEEQPRKNSEKVNEEQSDVKSEQDNESSHDCCAWQSQAEQEMQLDKSNTKAEATRETVQRRIEESSGKEVVITEPEREKEPRNEKVENEKQGIDTEDRTRDDRKSVGMEAVKNEEKQVNMENKEADNDIEAEEGSGRFVEIDNEEFEVIDDMDEEESGDDDNKELPAVLRDETENNRGLEQVTSDTYIEQLTEIAGKIMPEDMEQTIIDCQSGVSNGAATSYAATTMWPHSSYQVHITGEELILVGIICSYLRLCPLGATSGEIRDYLSRQFKEKRKDIVERLLCSLPVLFKAEDVSGNAKWKFSGFQNLAEFKAKA
ncbi:golgin subfamily A member 6-like protein 24 [Montipora capricornis]|uniref:golgin subfamily A member 6-like protein 24 n=1 Tax=Montipora capricornis TaxID=246305 RepID=UPI0035F1A8C6